MERDLFGNEIITNPLLTQKAVIGKEEKKIGKKSV